MSKHLILLILSLTLVSGCGFERRGSFELSSVLSSIAIEGGNRSLNERLRERLQQSSVTVADSAGATLVISKSEFQRVVRTVDKNGLATSYDYTYTVDYNVTANEQTILQPRATISQHRTLDYEPAQALAIDEEEAFLKEEMEQEIISRLLRRLSRIADYSAEVQ